MSFAIQKSDFTVINSVDDWQPRPAMQAGMSRLSSHFCEVCPGAECGDTWVSFDNMIGRTTIFATPIDMRTPEGLHLLDRLVVKTDLPRDAWDLSDTQVVAVNTLATTGALMRDPGTGELAIVSHATFIDGEGQEDWLREVYVPVVSAVAIFHPYCLVSCGGPGQSDPATGATSGLEFYDAPSRWGQEDFKPAEAALRQAGVFSNGGSTGLAAEFPWDDGAILWVTDDETSLLTFQTEARHPHLGNGLFFKLELPTAFPDGKLVELVHYLNRLEVTGVDVPPFFGAWCSRITTRRIAYVGFIPNIAYWPGSVMQIAAW